MRAEVILFENLSKRSGVRHLLSKRDRRAPLEFSLALHTGQDPEKIRSNRDRLREYFGEESRFVSLLQVHGDRVHRVWEKREFGWSEFRDDRQGDAMITGLPGVVLTILTADCVPILLYDPVRKAVGAAHAGWRGTDLEILPKTIRAMQEEYGSRPEELLVGIGPAIGACCYEVGLEVAERFVKYPHAVASCGEKFRLDLKEINRLQALKAGVKEMNIEHSPICTSCEREEFFSYRAEDGCDGRFASCIMLEG